ncbi:hypothetical protein TNCV_1054281 [Trichonephila clavipes]|nr:hypothetical protein TNCV_1054281 [Trichonephila clavipes]
MGCIGGGIKKQKQSGISKSFANMEKVLLLSSKVFGTILRIAVHRKDRTSERRIYTSGEIKADREVYVHERGVAQEVYKVLSKTLEDLRNNIRAEIGDIPVDMLEKVSQSSRHRLHQCIENGG